MANHNDSHEANTLIVLDFETSGLSPNLGDRAIEIGAVLIENGKITDRFQQVMNPGFPIDPCIESYTGITNPMIEQARPCAEVMQEFADFIGDYYLVAHNASFDKRFLDAELAFINRSYPGKFLCSLLIARRIYQNAPNHKLGSLVAYRNNTTDGVFHIALADSEMTAKLLLAKLEDLHEKHDIETVSYELMRKLSRQAKNKVQHLLDKHKTTEAVT
jgi:DNA polymerase-3 subunit epsilon